MNRQEATQITRDLMDQHGLNKWKLRLVTDVKTPFLGRCAESQQCIYLNAHHIDQHHIELVKDTVLHEIAHALVGCSHQHDDIWRAKAKEIGSHSLEACVSFGLSLEALDAIRSGHIVEVEYTEEVVRKPKHTIHKLTDLCPTCGKVAKELTQITTSEVLRNFICSSQHTFSVVYDKHKVPTCPECNKQTILFADEIRNEQDVQFTMLTCGHVIKKIIPRKTPYHLFISQGLGNKDCNHQWNNPDKPTECTECGALKLYPFQVEGAHAIEQGIALNKGFGLFDDMGLGKTVQPLPVIFYHQKERLPYLLIGKAGVKYQYLKEIVKWLGVKHFPQVISTSRDALLPGMSGYIISYAALRKFDIEKFKKIGIKTVLLDECQSIKNPDATQTAMVREIVKEVDSVIPLSGTPWKNRGNEYFVVLNMLDPKKFYSYEDFKRRWVDTYWEGNKQKIGGIREPERFKEFIKHIAIRREREVVMPELPRVNRTKFYCEVPEYARTAYNEEVKRLVNIAKDAAIDGTEGSFKNNAEIMKSLIVMRQIVGIAKVPSTLEYCEQFLEECDRKLVIFVHHKKCAYMIEEGLKKRLASLNGDAPELFVLSAELNPLMRSQVQDNFNKSKRAFMVASTLASGEGLNLQTCSDCVMHERQWNPANEEQAEGRFIRIGQLSDKVNAVYVEAEETVDSHLDKIVSRKRIAFHKVMSANPDAGQITWNEGSIIKELVSEIVASYNKANTVKSKQVAKMLEVK